ncbi:hypothetical protein V438_15040 [Clostridioides difficile]|uniref:Uncharacterized protein n=1 Tax=Clostridioides difficile NAP08 TaxID=525259 RepID=D5PZX2_CLODI|nr:hypothetical protein HMPREF0220_0204 [Clostridioides difficile NAP08]EFH14037.1 hypothetical protein HMPREF0219_3322 [Clostridioides difficile NAP07]PCD11627.1 hypothetical protein V439_13870 [Clostridioides difficile]CCK89213.1 conserved hypothetical protein [Clostridioides difficile T5]CCK92591.1 conserved hypothetical protein [Clostridioides difficile T20]CCK96353.1 conserved hypothetical protein [Clostridioides difficile E1]CCL00374.1 conserved hypothetical protein [Clostridioides diff
MCDCNKRITLILNTIKVDNVIKITENAINKIDTIFYSNFEIEDMKKLKNI